MRPEYSLECAAAEEAAVKLLMRAEVVGLGQKLPLATLLEIESIRPAGITFVTPSPVAIFPETGSRMYSVVAPAGQVTVFPVTPSVLPQVTWRVLNGL